MREKRIKTNMKTLIYVVLLKTHRSWPQLFFHDHLFWLSTVQILWQIWKLIIFYSFNLTNLMYFKLNHTAPFNRNISACCSTNWMLHDSYVNIASFWQEEEEMHICFLLPCLAAASISAVHRSFDCLCADETWGCPESGNWVSCLSLCTTLLTIKWKR